MLYRYPMFQFTISKFLYATVDIHKILGYHMYRFLCVLILPQGVLNIAYSVHHPIIVNNVKMTLLLLLGEYVRDHVS